MDYSKVNTLKHNLATIEQYRISQTLIADFVLFEK